MNPDPTFPPKGSKTIQQIPQTTRCEMEPLKPDFEPITDKNLAYRHEFATLVGMNNTIQCTWKRSTKEQASREWAGTVTIKMEVGVGNEQVRDLLWFVDNGAAALIEALDSVRFERAS